MSYWGLSGLSHDAALAVVNNTGEIVFASHSERYTGNKHDAQFGNGLIDAALSYGHPDATIWYETDWLKRLRQARAGQWDSVFEDPTPRQDLRNNFPDIFYDWADRPAPEWRQYRHHLTHAAAGFATSPYADAAVLVIDAIGEFNSASIWRADSDSLGNCTYKLVEKINYPHSLGLVYSAFTQRVGLRPLDEEYILMGMAAYGKPIYADERF
jgi:carbamoyltransferase